MEALEHPRRARLRADGDVRPAHGVHVARTAGTTLPVEERARLLARQGQGYTTADPVRVVDEDDARRAARRRDDGRGRHARQQRDGGLLRRPRGHRDGVPGGWFHSGDLAVWHPDDAIELRDRGKDVIISGGENISSIEVEQTICAHPAVLECAVVAIPDDRWGERPKAFVTLAGRRHGHRGGDHRVLPRAPRALQVPRRDRVRPAARRRRPARCRSSRCASRSGPAGSGGSTRWVIPRPRG